MKTTTVNFEFTTRASFFLCRFPYSTVKLGECMVWHGMGCGEGVECVLMLRMDVSLSLSDSDNLRLIIFENILYG